MVRGESRSRTVTGGTRRRSECPNWSLWYGTGTMPAPYGLNSSSNPWRCVLAGARQLGRADGRLDDRRDAELQGDREQQVPELEDRGRGHTAATTTARPRTPPAPTAGSRRAATSATHGSSASSSSPTRRSRACRARRSRSRSSASPASTSWAGEGRSASENDPCPDPDFKGVAYSAPDKGTVQGVFVAGVQYEPGPVDENAVCTEDLLTFCRPTLVR